MAGRGRPFVVAWRDGDDEAALKAAYRAEPDAEVKPRLHALWLVRAGRRLGEVADVVGVDYRTVQRWVAWYRQGGRAELQRRHMGGVGQPSRLTPEQQERVAREVATGRFRTAAAIRGWVAEAFRVDYTEGGTYSLLARLRLAPKVPRPVHERADLRAQAAWKKGGSRAS